MKKALSIVPAALAALVLASAGPVGRLSAETASVPGLVSVAGPALGSGSVPETAAATVSGPASAAGPRPAVLPGRRIAQEGAFLRPLQQRDSILIADQLDYGFTLKNVAEGTSFALPDYRNTPMDSLLALIRPWKIDTLKVRKPGKGRAAAYDIEASIRIAAFDEGTYRLPPLAAVRLEKGVADTLLFEAKEMEVHTLPVDTATFQVHDLKGQIRYPVTFKEALPYIGAGLAAGLLLALIIWAILKYGPRSKEAEKKREPAHIVALRALDAYRGSKWWAPERQKAFYSGITDILRAYIAARYDFGAKEMTTGEIFTALKRTDLTAALYEELKQLFELSDFVKFAKLTVADEENAGTVPLAVRFVTETYQTEIDREAETSRKAEAGPPKSDRQPEKASGTDWKSGTAPDSARKSEPDRQPEAAPDSAPKAETDRKPGTAGQPVVASGADWKPEVARKAAAAQPDPAPEAPTSAPAENIRKGTDRGTDDVL